VLAGLSGDESIPELCRCGGIASSMYYGWSKESRRNVLGDFIEIEFHRLNVALWQDEAHYLAFPGPDSTKDVGRCGPLAARNRRPRSALRFPQQWVILFFCPVRSLRAIFLNVRWETLKSSTACA
jgi:hypothetical protein